MEKSGFFEVSAGDKSSMRLMCFISLMNASCMAWYSMIKGELGSDVIVLISMFLIGAFAPKAVQKFAERK